jgi:hypothetical protein
VELLTQLMTAVTPLSGDILQVVEARIRADI